VGRGNRGKRTGVGQRIAGGGIGIGIGEGSTAMRPRFFLPAVSHFLLLVLGIRVLRFAPFFALLPRFLLPV
jgi:hypothetical protein